MSEAGLMVRNEMEQPKPTHAESGTVGRSRIEEHSSWPVLAKLPVAISAGVAMKRFRVRDVLGLQKGQVFETASPETEDVLLMAGKVHLAWSEFEVVDRRLVVRLTRLA
jgi:flagellar motor switch/type III secretory pathway protein FliN